MDNILLNKVYLAKSNKTATLQSIALKNIFLLIVTIISALATIIMGFATPTIASISGIISIGLIFVLFYRFSWAQYIAPIYAILQGILLSNISLMLETMYPGIVLQAIVLTLCVALVVACIYLLEIIRVTDSLKKIVCLFLMSILLCYIIEYFAEILFGFSFIMLNTGIIGLMIDIGILIVAAMCLLIDYDEINEAVQKGLDPNAEWYYAFALLVDIVFIYVRMLHVLIHTRD